MVDASDTDALAGAIAGLHLHDMPGLLILPTGALASILDYLCWSDMIELVLSCKSGAALVSTTFQHAAEAVRSAWSGAIARRPFQMPAVIARWLGAPAGQASRVSSVLVWLPWPADSPLARPDPLLARVCRMVGSEAYAAAQASPEEDEDVVGRDTVGPGLRDVFPGLPESVWLDRLEQLLGADFTQEHACAHGLALAGHKVVAHGLGPGRSELNGACGTVIKYDRKTELCWEKFDNHGRAVRVRPCKLRRAREPSVGERYLQHGSLAGLRRIPG